MAVRFLVIIVATAANWACPCLPIRLRQGQRRWRACKLQTGCPAVPALAAARPVGRRAFVTCQLLLAAWVAWSRGGSPNAVASKLMLARPDRPVWHASSPSGRSGAKQATVQLEANGLWLRSRHGEAAGHTRLQRLSQNGLSQNCLSQNSYGLTGFNRDVPGYSGRKLPIASRERHQDRTQPSQQYMGRWSKADSGPTTTQTL